MAAPKKSGSRKTVTSNFGVGRREGHDATPFYQRFRPPEISTDDNVLPPTPIDEPFVCGDARNMDTIADGSVALVVTSPPYFAGKQYEEELDREGVPASYLEYLELLTDVFAECVRKLEPGGRIAVNVANLGRKPYRSLSSDVTRILEDELGLLMRGELIWQKAEGASGSCAWGSFRSAANPVLRDITERVIVASKGRFDRARTVKQREAEGLPFENTSLTEDFMAATLDLWPLPPESARRVGHPAPFPVELPEQLIELYTYRNDLVLDPFMGSGSALIAAARLDRRYVGYDLDPAYVEIARGRVTAEGAPQVLQQRIPFEPPNSIIIDAGRAAQRTAGELLEAAGFTIEASNRRIRGAGLSVSFVAVDGAGEEWWFDVAGPFTTRRGGLSRAETVWKSLGRAHAIRGVNDSSDPTPLVFLTTQLPKRSSEGERALRAAGSKAVFDVVDLLAIDGRRRLGQYAAGGLRSTPLSGFWSARELSSGA